MAVSSALCCYLFCNVCVIIILKNCCRVPTVYVKNVLFASYSREEPFTVLNIDIRNQQNLLESLEQYVKGDLLEGANAYHCEKCNKKVGLQLQCTCTAVIVCLFCGLECLDAVGWVTGRAIIQPVKSIATTMFLAHHESVVAACCFHIRYTVIVTEGMLPQDAPWSWKVMEFRKTIFQAGLESHRK